MQCSQENGVGYVLYRRLSFAFLTGIVVVPLSSGQELTIWDSKESEFASGLEYRQVFDSSDPIDDLDWTATPDNQSILAVGFTHRVELLCQRRMTYFDESPGWGTCWRIDLTHTIPHAISDSVWLKRGTLLIGAGHIMLLYGHSKPSNSQTKTPGLFESVARYNGPLDDYHPQMILQCLLWEKVELVKNIIVRLARYFDDHEDIREWHNLPTEQFMKKDGSMKAASDHHPQPKQGYSQLFSLPDISETDGMEDDQFSPVLVQDLLEHLEDTVLPHLTPNEHQSLVVLIQTTLQIHEKRRALDPNGLRYLTMMRIFYNNNRKVKLVHGLWRQAAGHREQVLMLKFLNNDFDEPRWRTAALKNAFALLSKRRFEYAAAFFLLGGSLKDAVNVCLRNLQDFQLALALARVAEQDEEGPIFKDILHTTVIPTAFREGNRWLASWAFWMLHRRDLAVRVLLSPLQDLASSLSIAVTEIGEPHFDDPSLALLFSQLKTKTLQTAKGTSEISGRTEFNFVLQMSRVFCRMGCHALALDLVRTWSFDRPSVVMHDPARPTRRPPSPITTRFALEPALRRRSSIMIDMHIDSLPPTRPASPEKVAERLDGILAENVTGNAEVVTGENDLIARKAGIGSLMKSAKQDLSVPEFDMNSFF
ncbi:hypothetical protein EUX98_g174 [Antrodiella citrinella]|uniref:RAVE complex protein Rav1 C-terminal domain-containing protein n=1 Tax=Antrodiella citrinella TaxID=2447956 RepID=A0A4S4N512_9APHY|nr:hypothetical protein EUX98_g174 [Antrodiella citrinella]